MMKTQVTGTSNSRFSRLPQNFADGLTGKWTLRNKDVA